MSMNEATRNCYRLGIQTFPGYIEVTCPCCERFRHVKKDELRGLSQRHYAERTSIVCDDCWKVVESFTKPLRKRVKRLERFKEILRTLLDKKATLAEFQEAVKAVTG